MAEQMTDILFLLRLALKRPGGAQCHGCYDSDIRRAADEIERLRAEVKLWKSRCDGIVTWGRPEVFKDQQRGCKACGGSGFDTPGSGYGNVCSECGGQSAIVQQSADETKNST